MSDHEPIASAEAVEAFIARSKGVDGTERANYQLFLTELCRLLDLPEPEPAREDEDGNVYVFERRVRIQQPDGTVRLGFIDLYRRVTFVLEAKQSGKEIDSKGWDKAMIPHHSLAITRSERFNVEDVRVCELAVAISEAQRREILEMDWLIDDIAQNGPAATPEEAQARPVPDFDRPAARQCPSD